MIWNYRNAEPCWAPYLRARNAGDGARYLGNRSLAKAKTRWFFLFFFTETKRTAAESYSWCIPRAFKCFLALKQLSNLLFDGVFLLWILWLGAVLGPILRGVIWSWRWTKPEEFISFSAFYFYNWSVVAVCESQWATCSIDNGRERLHAFYFGGR